MSIKKVLILTLFILSFSCSYGQKPRHPAEWEEISSVVMEFRYFKHSAISWDDTLDPFIKTAQACIDENIDFYILKPTKNSIYNNQIDLDSLFKAKKLISPLIHIIPIDSIGNTFPWIRDHGMNFVYKNDYEKPHLYNFSDDHTGQFITKTLGLNTTQIQTKLDTIKYYTDGGNFLTDGHGTFNITVTDLSENQPTELNLKHDYFYDKLGIQKTLNISAPFVHTDYFLKLINEETALISFIPNDNYDISLDKFYDHQYYIDQAAIAIKQNLSSVYGRDIDLIPIQNAPTTYNPQTNTVLHTAQATYTNSLIINHTVLVPQYNIKTFDSIALKTYQKMMPGYNIVGINCRQYGELSGAIHCLTHEIYTDKPIYTKHKWYKGTIDYNISGYPIKVMVKSKKNIKNITLFWKTDKDKNFIKTPLLAINSMDFISLIPSNKKGDSIYYYLKIETHNKIQKLLPINAPVETYFFKIK